MRIFIFFTAFLMVSNLFAVAECQEAKTYLSENKAKILNHLTQGFDNNPTANLKENLNNMKNMIAKLEGYIDSKNDQQCKTYVNAIKNFFKKIYGIFSGG